MSTSSAAASDQPPYRQIRAVFDEAGVTVYQAYKAGIALDAVRRGRFSNGYNRERMTWIKPSFLWMMYRSGWATKEDQEYVLAIRLNREGFEAALGDAVLSHFDPDRHEDEQAWRKALREAPVRVQWDPERDLRHTPLGYRAVQIGLSGRAVHEYCDTWITGIEDTTPLARQIHGLIREGREDVARELLPREVPYPLSVQLAAAIGATARPPLGRGEPI